MIRYGLVGGVIFLLLLPFLPILIWSGAEGWYFPQVWPETWSGQGWAAVFAAGSKVGVGFGQSLLIATLVTLLALLVGIPAGRAMGLESFWGKAWFRWFLLLPMLVSPLAVLLGIQFVMIRLRLQGSLLGVVLVHLLPTIPYMTLVMSSVFANFDTNYEKQARALGADPWQVWRHVTLPMVLPGIAASGLFAFLISWNEFLLTFFVGGGQVFTLPMVLFTLLQGGNNGLSAAVAMTSILPGVILLGLTSRILGQSGIALAGLAKS
ncbi:MAG: ABC transporter permease subunit [Cyanobacteriota bacterium]|nr:ABC transporter permease subunit [Cyanobacteriota bacterium]